MRQLLIDENGEIYQRDVMKAAKEMGYAERTVQRARNKLGLTVKQTGFGKNKKSLWVLPPNSVELNSPNHANNPSIMPTNLVGTHGMNGTNDDDNTVEVEI